MTVGISSNVVIYSPCFPYWMKISKPATDTTLVAPPIPTIAAVQDAKAWTLTVERLVPEGMLSVYVFSAVVSVNDISCVVTPPTIALMPAFTVPPLERVMSAEAMTLSVKAEVVVTGANPLHVILPVKERFSLTPGGGTLVTVAEA